jgi:hypothetical protein
MKEPVFLKENNNSEKQLEQLFKLEPLLNSEGQAKIRQDIKCLEYGIEGEKNVAFELKNSHMPIYIMHDIYLDDGDLNAQIDYIVVTRKICFIIECKNLFGDIEINNAGDFIRTMEFGGRKKKEGIYSPITQNQRHMELIKKLKVDKNESSIIKFIAGRYFEDFNKSIVVLANPKTVLNAKYAKKEVKEKVIRADQLVAYIKFMCKNSKESESSDERMLEWANSYLELHKETEKDYTGKYDMYRLENDAAQSVPMKAEEECLNIEETEIYKELRAYRLLKSREEKIKPYLIYNNDQLKELISKMPKSKDELKKVNGFSEEKANKYGRDIIVIVSKYL